MSSLGNQREMAQILALEMKKMEVDLLVQNSYFLNKDNVGQSTTGNTNAMESINQPSNLLDLNEDCVREIFKFLNASELCLVAEACTATNSTNLKEIAKDIFKGSHKIWNFDNEAVTSIGEARRIFSNFGTIISEVQIDFTYLSSRINLGIDAPYKNEDLLDVVVEFCSNPLQSLTIKQYAIPEKQLVTLRPLFNTLQKLHLIKVSMKGVGKDLFGNCGSLVELNAQYSDDNMLVCENDFPKLERFAYCTPGYLNLENFVTRHKNLETIGIRSMDPWTSYMSLIADNCKQLKELDIRVTDPHENPDEYKKAVASVLSLEHLKELTIDCDLRHLRELKLFRCFKLSNINEVGNFTGLTSLSITQWNRHRLQNVDLKMVELIKRLINLRKFMFDGDSFRMDKAAYMKILNAVQQRTIRSQHKLEIGCACVTVDLPISEEYRHIVKMQMKNFE